MLSLPNKEKLIYHTDIKKSLLAFEVRNANDV